MSEQTMEIPEDTHFIVVQLKRVEIATVDKIAAEIIEVDGVQRLGIFHTTTKPYTVK